MSSAVGEIQIVSMFTDHYRDQEIHWFIVHLNLTALHNRLLLLQLKDQKIAWASVAQ